MARRLGMVSKAWEKLRCLVTRETFVGIDANGNRYYRWTDKDVAGDLIERRRVRVPGNNILYDPKVIPPEWRGWLAKTRQNPPTEEEMARSATRAAIMQERIAAIEEREQQRRIRQESLGQQATAAAGPDINKFMSQLEHKGYGAGSGQGAGNAGSYGRGSQAGDSSSKSTK
eukprot:GHRR01012593.1.p1 GENE.GHRR01012593.1~~GHRR01012593.1.p1  ORF type:complete len:172 (+),score=65.34 GHRR01012593.1:299-814(+)